MTLKAAPVAPGQPQTAPTPAAARPDEPRQDCPQCGHAMHGVRGSRRAICPNCGFKDACCY